MFQTILVAVDGTRQANRALASATALAKSQNATLHILHVIDEMTMMVMLDPTGIGVADYIQRSLKHLNELARKVIADAEKAAKKAVRHVDARIISSRGRTVADVILGYARKIGADVIVLGTHGRRGIGRLLMGSDAESVLRNATVPVLLVRSPDVKRAVKRKRAVEPARAKRRSEKRTLAAATV